MAKRKRKMTLFDVMHTGQSVGLQVRTRVPTYQPTPELPVTKKLAKLFGRAPRNPDANAPRSAADELEQLRRELAPKAPAPEPEPEPVVQTKPEIKPEMEAEPVRPVATSTFASEEPVAKPAPKRAIDRLFEETVQRESPREPLAPRRSFREVLRGQWAIASPKLEALTVHLKSLGGHGANHAAGALGLVRELYSRYAVTTGAALGVVVLLCGSFYAGKLLFNRPAAVGLSGTNVANSDVRPDVLNLSEKGTRPNEAIANIDAPQTETKLERRTDPTPTKTGVFGGRRPDLNYVIIQSYLSQAEAEATMDVLAKYGVKTTVELNLPRWAMAGKNLYSVVSVEGFQKMTGNAEFQAYLTNVSKISDKETGNTLPKKLDPRPYKLQPANP